MPRLTPLGPSRATAAIAIAAAVLLAGVAIAAKTPGNGNQKAGPSEEVAFANVLEDGTIDPRVSSNNIGNANISNPSPGIYCISGLKFTLTSAVVSGDNSFANNDTIASVAIDNIFGDGEDLGGCPFGTFARVRTLDANGAAGSNAGPYAPTLVNHRFQIWIRGDHKKPKIDPSAQSIAGVQSEK